MHTHQAYDYRELSLETAFVFSKSFPVLPSPGIVFWKWDPVSGPRDFSPQWRLPSGIAESIAQGEKVKSWWERILEEDRVILDKACADCASGTDASFDLTVRVRRSAGDWGWLLVRGGAVTDAGGQHQLVGYATDVSKLSANKRFFAQSAEISETFRATLKKFSDSIPGLNDGFTAAANTFPVAENPSVSRGKPGASTAWNLEINEELMAFHEHNVAEVFKTGAMVRAIARLHTSVKGETVGEYCYLPEFGPDGTVCAVICQMRDISGEFRVKEERNFTEEKFAALNRHTHDLEKAKKMAETANRTKDEFLANVSHELRTPLNGMLSMMQLLQHSSLSKEQQEYVRAATLSGNALLRILSDILDFSRMESGKMDLRSGVFDLKETLLSTMSLFVSEARSKGLETEVFIDERLPGALLGDDARVRQIVFNLVGNALKFTAKGKISLECSLLPYARGDNVRIYIVVRDTGIGIPPQSHSTIFEAFTQLDNSSTREHSGTGLGLGIVKRLVRMMGGNLTVESDVGEGTAIHCSLPFTQAGKHARAGARCDHLVVGAGPRRLDILVAEDDAVGRFALHAFLQRTGHRAVCVETGWHALAALQLHTFDCLITDIQMPVMDGLETVRRIRQGHLVGVTPSREVADAIKSVIPGADIMPRANVPRDMPVVALTAHAMQGDREYFLRMGMDMYLAKPIILEELAMTLRRLSERGLSTTM